MSRDEQEKTRNKYYNEAIRYMDNAKATLKHANKRDGFYQDKKYVKTACGTAYNTAYNIIEKIKPASA